MSWRVGLSERCPGNGKWAVIRDVDGSVVSCHDTRMQAQAQMQELYAHEEIGDYTPTADPLPGPLGAGARRLALVSRDGSTMGGAVSGCQCDHDGDCTGTCQTGCGCDCGEGASGAFNDTHGKPEGTPDKPPAYTVPTGQPAIGNQVPWHQTGPALIPCPYTTPTTQTW